MQCLNLSNKEVKAAVDELTTVLGSADAAYYIISENNGYAIDLAPDGALSLIFLNYLNEYNGDRNKAIRVFVTNNYIPSTVESIVNMQSMMFPNLRVETDANTVLLNLLSSNIFYQTDFSKQLAALFSPEVLKHIKVIPTWDLKGKAMAYQYSTNTIYVNNNVFGKKSAEYISNSFNHEIIHAYTVYEYANNPLFRNKVDDIFNRISKKFPKEKYGRKGLYYGLTDGFEFLSEVMTNSAFRDLVAKNDMPTWRKFLLTILNMLGFDKLANKVKGFTTERLINEIQFIINERNEDPDIVNIGDGMFYMDSDDPKLLELKKNSKKITEKIINGLKARYRSLLSLNYPALQLSYIQLQIDEYNDILQKEEDKLVLVDFIEKTSIAFKPVLKRIRNAYNNPDIITVERLILFLNDFLDFYGPMIELINKSLFLLGYFDDLDPQILDSIRTEMKLITRAYMEAKGKYDYILKSKVKDLITQYANMYKVPKEDIELYIEDKLNSTTNDINLFKRMMQSTKSLDDLAIRIAHRLMTDINNEVSRFANSKALELIREFSKINKSDCLLYFEKDKNGKATGYLVRDRNYGEFKKDLKNFLKELDAEYGVVDNNYYALSDKDFFEYIAKKEEWLQQHCERKFKPEYYEAYNKLSPITRIKLKSLNGEISNIIQDVTDADGPHLERLTDKQWLQLDNLYSVKRNLANIYYLDGELKSGEDLEIAEDLLKFYEVTGDGKIKSTKFTLAEISDIIAKKKKELTPELFLKWIQRNISYQYSDEFVELLKNLPKTYDMGEDSDLYESLVEERRKLLNLGKDNNQPATNAYKLTELVKARLLEIDQDIAALRIKHKGGASEFSKIARMVETPLYIADKKKYKAMGNDAYDDWFMKSHVFVKGKYTPASFYTKLIPRDPSFIEMRLSRMNQELDKDSELVNDKYDFSNPEYYQPKKSLYDNTKAFNQATNTAEKQAVYKLIVDTMNEANSKISFLSKKDNYKLPLITGDIIDFTLRGNKFFDGIAAYNLDNILIKNDDSEYTLDNFTLKPDGSSLFFVPTHYVKMLQNPEHISRNLVGMLTEYSRMAENYKLKNDRKSDFELLSLQLAKRELTKYNYTTFSRLNIEGVQSELYKKYRDFLEMNLYGQYKKPLAIKLGNSKAISVTKIMDNIRSYATASNLSNNIPAIAKALFQGIHKSVVEALAGRYFSANNYFKALAQCVFNIPNMILHLANPKHNNVLLALMEHNEIARDTSTKTEHLQYNRLVRIFRKYLIWGGWNAVDYFVKAPVLSAIYSDYKYIPSVNKMMSKREYIRVLHNNDWKEGNKAFKKLNTFSLRDVYTVKDGKPVIKDKYSSYADIINDSNLLNSVKNITKFLTNRIDGILSTEDKTRLMTNAFGAAIFMHRSFFVNNMEDNFLVNYQYNPYIEDYQEAKYTSLFKVLWNYILNMYTSIKYYGDEEVKKTKHKTSSDVQLYNFKRTLIQLSLVSMYSILTAIWLRPAADDDEENWLLLLFGYSVAGMSFEERAEYNPMDFFNQIKSPSAAIAPVENLTNFFKLYDITNIENNWSDDEIRSGSYKELTKWQRSIIKATPGLRGLWESQDIRTKWQYLDSQLDKTTKDNE